MFERAPPQSKNLSWAKPFVNGKTRHQTRGQVEHPEILVHFLGA
jgi:hypothetical protein